MAFWDKAKEYKDEFLKAYDKTKNYLSLKLPKTFAQSSILLSVIEKERVRIEKSISTHILESGAVISDHIVEKPVTIEIEGFIARKYIKPRTYTYDIAEDLYNKINTDIPFTVIGLIDRYSGLSSYTRPIRESIRESKLISKIKSTLSDITKTLERPFQALESLYNYYISNTSNEVADTFILFESLANNNVPLTYTTQFKVYENMFITYIDAVTDVNTGIYAAKIVLKLEQAKWVDSVYKDAEQALLGRRDNQYKRLKENGSQQLDEIPAPQFFKELQDIDRAKTEKKD